MDLSSPYSSLILLIDDGKDRNLRVSTCITKQMLVWSLFFFFWGCTIRLWVLELNWSLFKSKSICNRYVTSSISSGLLHLGFRGYEETSLICDLNSTVEQERYFCSKSLSKDNSEAKVVIMTKYKKSQIFISHLDTLFVLLSLSSDLLRLAFKMLPNFLSIHENIIILLIPTFKNFKDISRSSKLVLHQHEVPGWKNTTIHKRTVIEKL